MRRWRSHPPCDCVFFAVQASWSYGVTVSTLDSESSDRGSNPRRTFSRIYTRSTRLSGVYQRDPVNGVGWWAILYLALPFRAQASRGDGELCTTITVAHRGGPAIGGG